MAEHTNAQAIRKGFEAFQKGDQRQLMELCSEDATWHGAPGSTLISGDFKGRDAILAMIATSVQAAEGTMKFQVHDILANDEHVVALVNGTAKRRGQTISGPSTFVFHMQNGKVTEAWVHGDTDMHEGWEEFWAK